MVDPALTLVLLAPIALSVVAWMIGVWSTPPSSPHRLSDADVRRMYRITAERAGKYANN